VRSSNKVLEFKMVGKAFGTQKILNGAYLTIYHGERVEVIGANGMGKSVLIKLAPGQMAADCGDVVLGPSIVSAYYAQEHETLDPEQKLCCKPCSWPRILVRARQWHFWENFYLLTGRPVKK
jgi:ATPase subunit of ABC transporter with duplicated ATPase domains